MQSSDDDRGRYARSPLRIPLAGWIDVLSRVAKQVVEDRVSSSAASVAFFGVLALFPALVGTLSLYALCADPAALALQLRELSVALPASVRSLVVSELAHIVARSTASSTLGLVSSVVVSLVVASSGVVALIDAVNSAYEERETRGFFTVRWLSLRLAIGLSLFVCLSVASLAVLPSLVSPLGLSPAMVIIVTWARWPAFAVAVMLGLSILYRYAPNRAPARPQWVVVGAALAAVIWLSASFGLSTYAENFGNYANTYGALGGAIVLLLWFYLSSFAIILGAELNSELEHQTTVDTTVGPERPIGSRQAVVADTIGEAREPRSLAETLGSSWRELRSPRRDKADSKRERD